MILSAHSSKCKANLCSLSNFKNKHKEEWFYIRIDLYLFLYRFLKQVWLILFLLTLIAPPQTPFHVALSSANIDIITYSIIEHVRK
jgi:hypothetical protein